MVVNKLLDIEIHAYGFRIINHKTPLTLPQTNMKTTDEIKVLLRVTKILYKIRNKLTRLTEVHSACNLRS